MFSVVFYHVRTGQTGDIIVSGYRADDGYINIKIRRKTDFVSLPVRHHMRNYFNYLCEVKF